MHNKVFLSIITCSKNNLQDLINTCESIKGFIGELPYIEFEQILILSCYDSDQIKQVESKLALYTQNIRVNIFETQPIGISGSFNLGLEKASGDFIVFLNAGDQFVADNACINYIQNNFLKNRFESNTVYYFDIFTKGRKKNYFNSRRISYPAILNYYHFLKMGNPINHQATFYPLKIAQDYPYPEVLITMDYQVNFSMILDDIKFFKSDGVLVCYDVTGISAQKPFTRLSKTFAILFFKAWQYRLFSLLLVSLFVLPFSILKATIQKLTYNLR